jgi:beta-N-acetylhexosaminidase
MDKYPQTLKQKIGQLFSPAAFIYDTKAHIAYLEKLITEHHIGGLTFFFSPQEAAMDFEKEEVAETHSDSYQQLVRMIDHYQQLATYPLLISIDAEWGLAMRIREVDKYPYALALGACQNDQLIRQTGSAVGAELLDAGIHLNLAPVMDVNEHMSNPVIGFRSYGDNPQRVASSSLTFYRGMRDVGMLGCAKHFPGHGSTQTDSHYALPVIYKGRNELEKKELFPFQMAIEAKIDCIMPGHIAVPSLSGYNKEAASLSSTILKKLLREQMGFKGVTVSDALNMKAVNQLYPEKGELERKALEAGNDILCFSEHVEEGILKIHDKTPKPIIEESFNRVWELKEKSCLSEKQHSVKRSFDTALLRKELPEEIVTEITTAANQRKDFSLFKSVFLSIGYTAQFDKTHYILKSIYSMPLFSINSTSDFKEISSQIANFHSIIISLHAPQLKSVNNFGLSSAVIQQINQLICQKPTALIVFGNPYILSLLQYMTAQRTIIAYDSDETYQSVVAQILCGETFAKGKMPISFIR